MPRDRRRRRLLIAHRPGGGQRHTAKIGRKGGRALGFNLEYAHRLARLELLEKAEQILFDAVNDEAAPIRDRIRAAFYILDTVPPPDLWAGRRAPG
jgi:hypothetical protein